MTQRDLADKANITFSYISRLEAGGVAPGIDLLERLAIALDVNPIDLLPSPVGQDASREQLRKMFELLLVKSGKESLVILHGLLERLLVSVSIGN